MRKHSVWRVNLESDQVIVIVYDELLTACCECGFPGVTSFDSLVALS